MKQKAQNRDLPLPKVVIPVLWELLDRLDHSPFKGPDDLVFATDKGTPLDEKNRMRPIVKPTAKRLGMAWMSWHVFRHTHSTLAEDLGGALRPASANGAWRLPHDHALSHSDLNRRRQTLDLMADHLTGRVSENRLKGETASNF